MGKMYLVTPEPQAWESKIKFSPDEFFWDDVSVSKKITTSYKLKIATLRKNLGLIIFIIQAQSFLENFEIFVMRRMSMRNSSLLKYRLIL